jgi:hypothetical protein
MNKNQKWFVLICLMAGLGLGTLIAQQQFSGGQAVTVTSGTMIATQATGSNLHVAVDSAPTTAVTGTFWQTTQPISMAAGLPAGTNVIGTVIPVTGCGNTKVESGSPAGFVALAASTTTVESATTCILTLVVTNTGSSSFTYYVTDNAGTPISVIGSAATPITILPGERDEYTFNNGAKFNAGVKLTASATTGSYYLFGVQ